MKIRKVRTPDYQEPVREFYLLVRVRFSDHGAWNGEDNYYDDDELRGRIENWSEAAVSDRSDHPSVTFRSLPEILVVDVDSVFNNDYPGHTDGDET